MKTPTLRPATDRIVIIPEAPDHRPRGPIIVGALVVVAAMLLGGGVTYLWRQGTVRDRERDVQAAEAALAGATGRADGLQAQVGGIQQEIAALNVQLQAEKDKQDILRGQSGEAQRALARSEERIAGIKADLAAITGPRLKHGDHIAYVLAAGAAQVPQMAVIDPGRWFTGGAARKAATQDGALGIGKHLTSARYVRNFEHDWRVVTVAPGTLVTLRHYNGASTPTNVSLSTLATILTSTSASAKRIAHNPFWVTIEHGQITAMKEQRYQAP